MLIIKGAIKIHIDGQERLCNPGDIIICDRDQLHCSSRASEHTEAIIIVFDPNYIKQGGPFGRVSVNYLDKQAISRFNIPGIFLEEIHTCFFRVYGERTRQDALSFYLSETYLKILVGYLYRYASISPVFPSATPSPSSRIQEVLDYIDGNYATDITLEELSKMFSIPPTHLAQLFQQATGKGFGEYLKRLRIMKSKIHLCNTKDIIINIAMNCGFNNIRTYNRVFKSVEGITPTEYRKQIRRFDEPAHAP